MRGFISRGFIAAHFAIAWRRLVARGLPTLVAVAPATATALAPAAIPAVTVCAFATAFATAVSAALSALFVAFAFAFAPILAVLFGFVLVILGQIIVFVVFYNGPRLAAKAGCQRWPRGWRAIGIDGQPGAHQRVIRHDLDENAIALFQLGKLQPLAVQHIHRDRPISAQPELAGAAFHGLFLQQPQSGKRRTCRRADKASAIAHVANIGGGFENTGAKPLPAHFQQPEGGNAAHLDARPILAQRILHGALHPAVVGIIFHVDEIDHHKTRHVAQAKLPRQLFSGFNVGFKRGFLDIIFAGRAAGIHVHRNQRFGWVNHNIPARAKLHDRVHHCSQLALHPGTVKQRHRIGIELHLARMARHQSFHEGAGLLVAGFAIHIDFIDIAGINVADGAFDEVAVLINQRRRARVQRGVANLVPQPRQIIEIALDFGSCALKPRGADNGAHGRGQRQIFHDCLQPLAIGSIGNLPADAAALCGVWHQHRIAAGQRNIGGERRALVAALFLHNLHQHHLAAADDFLNLVAAAQCHAPTAERVIAILFGPAMLFRARSRRAFAASIAIVCARCRSIVFMAAVFMAAVIVGIVTVGIVMMIRFALAIIGMHIAIIKVVAGVIIIAAMLFDKALLFAQQGVAIFLGDLVIIRVYFGKGEEAVPVPAIIDEGRLQRRLNPCYLGEIDIALDLLAGFGLEIKFFDPVAFYHGNPGFLRVAGVDQHACCH